MRASGLLLGGSLAREGSPVPASIGGLPGETWDNFDTYAIEDFGEYMVTGNTAGDEATDEFIVRNGMIWQREGDVIDGSVVSGSIEGATLSESGNIAYVWDIEDAGSTIEALFFETTLLLKEGDSVDWDGDGMIDTNTFIEDFLGFGPNGLALANGTLYFVAEVDVNGSRSLGTSRCRYPWLSCATAPPVSRTPRVLQARSTPSEV